MRKVAKRKKLVDKIINSSTNILSVIYSHIYFPTYSNSLKDVARFLGCSWSEPKASSIQSIVWRKEWEDTNNEAFRQKLTIYNLEDCVALKKAVEVIQTVANPTVSDVVPPSNGQNCPTIEFVKNVEKLSDFHTWGKVNFVHSDYEYINKCAYFDYQRERVYVRTKKGSRKIKARKNHRSNRLLKGTKKIVLAASRCPSCKSKEVIGNVKKEVRTQEPRVKKAFDLSMTSSGIRRKILEVRTSVHKCLSCGEEFVPHQHRRLDKHFHGLKSWAIYLHVEYRVPLESIGKMIKEFFGINVFICETHMFKSLMARYYKKTFQGLLKKILSGNLLHVDETEVKLKKEKGYVWVFTNLEEVVYIYKPTREGGFLQELLKSFRGVLVSDFYAAYDSLPCAQQKCLIHLMRDINQDLLNNPFDEELQHITRPFGSLLREIIATIDEHGLKQKYLKKHETGVAAFFDTLSKQSFRSDAAQSLQERLIKYRNKLFTFINHDGVPWNNNNAEHAIKQFAYYREMANGFWVEDGLSDYLVLLSINQTCKYKEVSFLKFMLSKEQDIDIFRKKKRRKRRSPEIELYPIGFEPLHLVNAHKRRSRYEKVKGDPASEGTPELTA